MGVRTGVVQWLRLGVAVIGLAGSPATADEIVGEIVVEAGVVSPPVLVTTPEHRVVFVNRSGRPIHIEFTMGDQGEQHHLFQVPDHIWAVFHRPGPHQYAVHFNRSDPSELSGVVEVLPDPFGRPDALTCKGITVTGACLQP